MQQQGLPRPGEYLRLCPLLYNGCAKQKNLAQMKEQIKAQKKKKNTTKQRRDSQPIRCTVQNTGNQDAILQPEYGCKIEQKVKAMLSEIKEKVQGTNNDGNETGTLINSLEKKEERNIQPEQNEVTRIQRK